MPKYKSKKKLPKVVKEYLHNLFVENKIQEVSIHFSGSGDDGQIDDVVFLPSNIALVSEDYVAIPKKVQDSMLEIGIDFKNSFLGEKNIFSLENIIVAIVEHWIYDAPIDWVNGEGGAGSCVLTLKNDAINVKVNVFEWVKEEGPNFSCEL